MMKRITIVFLSILFWGQYSLAQELVSPYSKDFDGHSFIDEDKWAPHTGDLEFEEETNEDMFRMLYLKSRLNDDLLDISKTYYVQPYRLRVRDKASLEGKILGVLPRNARVKILSTDIVDGFVSIEILDPVGDLVENTIYYTAISYLGETKKSQSTVSENSYFMVQNIATEKIRVYKQNCQEGICDHQMVLETDMAAGENKDKTKTAVGHYRIKSWHKFYQDHAGVYPSWYDPNYPVVPRKGKGVLAWAAKKSLPKSLPQSSVRGAFGWYTAKVGPRSFSQWTHGTLGWGADKKKYIRATKGFWANLFTDPRSHGCSRTDNESIAYIRELMPVGSKIIKIYAKEAYGDPELSKYSERPSTWDYILTKNGVRRDGQKSDRRSVLKAGTPRALYIEEGTYEIDAYPSAKAFYRGKRGAKNGKNGNVYSLDHQDMSGVFLVDKGLLVNYKHPKKLLLGGYRDQLFPPYMLAKINTPYQMPKCRRGSAKTKKKRQYGTQARLPRCTENW